MLQKRAMVHIEADKKRNLLTFNYSKKVDAEEVRRALDDLRAALADMKPGFALLTDLTGLESMETGSARYIRQAMDLISKKGIQKVVRVIPDPRKDIGLNILSNFHYPRGLPIITCLSRADAERFL